MTSYSNLELGVLRFSVKNKDLVEQCWHKARSYQHFINIFLILRNLLYLETKAKSLSKADDHTLELPNEIDRSKTLKYFCSNDVLRAAIKGRQGGKQKEKVTYLKKALEDIDLFRDLSDVANTLQIKSIYKVLKKTNAAYQAFYTKLKKGDGSASHPKPKKLKHTHKITIPVDQDCMSFKKKGVLRVNIAEKMIDIPISQKQIGKKVQDLSKIKSCELVCTRTSLTVLFLYEKKKNLPALQTDSNKIAGLDVGIINTASIYILDEQSRSLVVNGKELAAFNCKINRKIAKHQATKDKLVNDLTRLAKNNPKDSPDILKISQKISYQDQRLSTLFSKRWQFFYTNFNKLANRILEYLRRKGVKKLYLSKNLGKSKNSLCQSLGKRTNQKFYQIPIIKLLCYIERKSCNYGIEVEWVDEAYTSKTSFISGDINAVQALTEKQGQKPAQIKKDHKKSLFSGRRVNRNYFKDSKTGKNVLADLNAAANHILVGLNANQGNISDFQPIKNLIWKISNPLKINALNCFLDRKILFS